MLFPLLAALLTLWSCTAQQQNRLPLRLSQDAGAIEGSSSNTCPSREVLEQARNNIKAAIRSILSDELNGPPCPCGGAGSWQRIAHLNMSDPSQQCPSSWGLVTTPERACGRLTVGELCSSAVFPTQGRSYSRVCGRVNAFQRGNPEAFSNAFGSAPDIEDVYIDGVSLTYGAAGSRQHIWSFAAARYETTTDPLFLCPCISPNVIWQNPLPSFIGNNYFCDTGNPGPSVSETAAYPDDPLWDGEGCGPASTCCQFNNPPWFCTTLPQPTTDNIELRICANGGKNVEDAEVQLVDIYIM